MYNKKATENKPHAIIMIVIFHFINLFLPCCVCHLALCVCVHTTQRKKRNLPQNIYNNHHHEQKHFHYPFV